MAETGPMPMIDGSQPATPHETMRANGLTLYVAALSVAVKTAALLRLKSHWHYQHILPAEIYVSQS
jgi:hypothetical protein